MKRTKRESHIPGFDYSTREAREETVAELFARARSARTVVESEWQKYNDYYNFIHDATAEVQEFIGDSDVPWAPCVTPDAWIAIESQIDPSVPEPEFRGRDSSRDWEAAQKREYAVKYIAENNRLVDMNTRNERRLLKYGDAFWKAYWDAGMRCGRHEGDIRIADVPVEAIYPDPSLKGGTIQDGQYVDYVYQIHKVTFAQLYARDLKKRGMTPAEVLSGEYAPSEGIFDMTTAIDETDSTVQILEHWFKQPEDVTVDGRKVEAGRVGCCIMAGGIELRYIPDYWPRTGSQNQLFPFVQYWRVQDENSVWNKSELFPILDLIDAADRKLAMGLLNDAFMSNDIILVEDGALAESAELCNEPGAVVKVKSGKVNSVARLGGLQSVSNIQQSMIWFKEQIERANRNYETGLGKETARATTATALSMMRTDAAEQGNIKQADRNAGFERLYELLDWLALEFFDDDRLIYLGADESRGREQDIELLYNSNSLAQMLPALRDRLTGEVVRPETEYWPRIDVTISAGDGVIKGKQATLQALQTLASATITAENYKLFAAQLEILDVPGKQAIIEEWEQRFQTPAMPGGTGAGLPTGAALPGMAGIQTGGMMI